MNTEYSSEAAETVLASGKANAERMADFSKSMMAKAVELPQRIFESNLETSAELFSFMSRRMQAQAEFLARLAHCQAAEEAMGVQREFAAHMTEDYSAEVSHLAEMTAEKAQENFRTLTEQEPNLEEPPKAETVAA
ncbi:phasin family protein [Amaricoccus macauensis]|uniref:phasin family protein n=1 Tax=Amaricoccus macauensis TaxID=57001 RepID=UPI003C7E1BFE